MYTDAETKLQSALNPPLAGFHAGGTLPASLYASGTGAHGPAAEGGCRVADRTGFPRKVILLGASLSWAWGASCAGLSALCSLGGEWDCSIPRHDPGVVTPWARPSSGLGSRALPCGTGRILPHCHTQPWLRALSWLLYHARF